MIANLQVNSVNCVPAYVCIIHMWVFMFDYVSSYVQCSLVLYKFVHIYNELPFVFYICSNRFPTVKRSTWM